MATGEKIEEQDWAEIARACAMEELAESDLTWMLEAGL